MKTLVLFTVFVLAAGNPENRTRRGLGRIRYGFFRSMEKEGPEEETRRVFGGEAADLGVFPAAAALLDRYWTTRCSGAIISQFWALTAAHCVTSRVAYIKYNTRNPVATEGNHSPVLYLYRHPNYKVIQEDEGRGMDVTLLHHDLGLLRSRDVMILDTPISPLNSMRKFNPTDLEKAEVLVMGFGRTEAVTKTSGEELFAVRLQLASCERGAWFHCICGLAESGNARGVCSGDSGGPVVYKGVQVAVTSMGPLECATARTQPQEGATSVFTALYHYVDLINATMIDTENVLKKRSADNQDSGTTTLKQNIPCLVMFIFALVT